MSSHLRKTKGLPSGAREEVDGLLDAMAQAREILAEDGALSSAQLDSLMLSFHLIKGYAQLLGFPAIERASHELESRVFGLRRPGAVDVSGLGPGQGLRQGARRLEGLVSGLHEAYLLEAAFTKRGGSLDCRALLERLERASRSLAAAVGLELSFRAEGQGTSLREAAREPVFAALLHSVRNSVAHGASPDGSVAIRVLARREGEDCVFECEDSGAGIDAARVRRAALDAGLRSRAELEGMGDDEALQLLFLPGLSLSESPGLLAGRGYGLSIVRDAIGGRLGGSARIESRPGRGARLVLRIPLVPLS